MTPLLRLNWGARNLFVVSNNASAVVGTLDLGQGNNALSNGVIVSSGGSLALTNSTGTLQLGGGSNSVGVHFTVADGGVLSGVQHFYFDSTQGHLLAFRGNGTDVTMTSENTPNKVESSSCRIEVTGGAKFTMKGSQGRIWAGAEKNNVSNTVYVAGAGSRLVCEGTGSFFGTAQNSCGNSLCVTDGAYAEFKRFHLGQHSGCNGNVCVVENNGVLVDKENDASSEAKCMVIGFGEGGVFAVSNRLLVASGGIVSNYVLSVGVSTNSVGNSVEIDGGEMYTGKDVYVARAGEASRLTVKNNGSIFIENLLTTAGADDFTNSVGVALSKKHEIEVLSGGTLSASSFTCRGADHKVTVSNGLFEVRGAGGFQLPYWSGGDGGSELVLAGTNPVVRSATAYNAGNYALAFRGSGRLRFVVPEFGYAQPPLQTTQGRLGLFNKAGSETCVFDVSACNPNRRISTVIAKAGTESDRLFVTDDWLERTRAALPEGARLEHKGNTLVFSYGSDGTVIIFR